MADYSGVHKRRGGPISQQQKPQPLKGFVSTNPTTVAVANTRTQTQRASNTTPSRAQHRSPASSAMGIKSGMTVEDLKRLTQQRMQQKAASAPVSTPVPGSVPLSDAGRQVPVSAPMNVLPKAGMTVQELKQLTSLRLATQNIPVPQQAVNLVNKGVVPNGPYIACMMTGNTSPKRISVTPHGRPGPAATASPIAPSLTMNRGRIPQQQQSDMQRDYDLQQQQQHRAMLYNMYAMPPNVAAMHVAQRHAVPERKDYSSLEVNAPTLQEINDFRRAALDLDEYNTYGNGNGAYDDQDPHYLVHQMNSLQFSDNSFPPPPPAPVEDDDDEERNGFFVATSSLPSWSPPPMRSKKLDSSVVPPPPPVGLYNQSIDNSYYTSATSKEDASRDQNAVIAPPPGLARRPSMTVPWQVAEAVLNTPQAASNRKQLASPTSSGKALGVTTPAAQLSRQRSGAALALATGAGQSPTLTPSTSTGATGGRRGSFGNAAEFFKFRRRSKSRLELARDLCSLGAATEVDVPLKENLYGSYGSTNPMMPGIDETMTGENISTIAHLDTEDGGDSSNEDDKDDLGDESDVVEFDGESSFISFYQQAGIGNLSIPPPPPPEEEEKEKEKTQQSSNGLPMMSPNGAKLRKVAELARRGSLSSEDKTRVKDEIIQSSLGIGANNAARIFSSQQPPLQRERAASNSDQRPPVSPHVAAPPGFQRMSSTPPRDIPKNTMSKTLHAGIVRSSSFGVATRNSPSKKLMKSGALSPTSATSLEERLATAAQKVADHASKGDMVGFQKAMEELDQLRNETNLKNFEPKQKITKS